jgi:hypothetical protein
MIKSILKYLFYTTLTIFFCVVLFYLSIFLLFFIEDRNDVTGLKNKQILNDKTFEIVIENDSVCKFLYSNYAYRLYVVDKDERILLKEDNYEQGYVFPYQYVFYKNNAYFLVRAKELLPKNLRIHNSLTIGEKRMSYDIDTVKLNLE